MRPRGAHWCLACGQGRLAGVCGRKSLAAREGRGGQRRRRAQGRGGPAAVLLPPGQAAPHKPPPSGRQCRWRMAGARLAPAPPAGRAAAAVQGTRAAAAGCPGKQAVPPGCCRRARLPRRPCYDAVAQPPLRWRWHRPRLGKEHMPACQPVQAPPPRQGVHSRGLKSQQLAAGALVAVVAAVAVAVVVALVAAVVVVVGPCHAPVHRLWLLLLRRPGLDSGLDQLWLSPGCSGGSSSSSSRPRVPLPLPPTCAAGVPQARGSP